MLNRINGEFASAHPGDRAFAARLRSYELAARMQVSIPEATRMTGESEATRRMYGLEDPANKGFARNCLMARRLLERGVRFVQIINGGAFGSPRINWDGHENLRENHDTQAATMDRPVAALIQDLKQRGMLDETLVNILRTRNMSEDSKRSAEKWQRAVRTVEWISSQMPVASQYQVYGFNTGVTPAIAGTEGSWLEVADRDQLNATMESVRQFVPANGTNLAEVFQAAAQLSPPPDNIYLITDGLPTLSEVRSNDTLVTPAKRLELFEDAVEYLPNRVPVNVILLPLEGDPSATAAYWQLAQMTKGSFLSPARDWP
jgi:hypothetical protein